VVWSLFFCLFFDICLTARPSPTFFFTKSHRSDSKGSLQSLIVTCTITIRGEQSSACDKPFWNKLLRCTSLEPSIRIGHALTAAIRIGCEDLQTTFPTSSEPERLLTDIFAVPNGAFPLCYILFLQPTCQLFHLLTMKISQSHRPGIDIFHDLLVYDFMSKLQYSRTLGGYA